MQIVDVQGRICAMPDDADSNQVEAVLMKLPVGIYVGVSTADSSTLPLTVLTTTDSGGLAIMGSRGADLFPLPHYTQQQQV